MILGLPDPVPLEPPAEDAGTVAALGAAIAGAAFGTGVLRAHLTGPAASAPGWLGRDAAAAAAQIAAVLQVAATAGSALAAAADRLTAHARVVEDARARVGVLRRHQEDDFAEARARLHVLFAPLGVDPLQPVPPAARALVDHLSAAEADRRRAHAALLAEVEDDAAATARVLADGSAAVGGTARRGDGDRVTAHLAALLPGWGNQELTARGAELARRFGQGPIHGSELEEAAREALPYAASAAYAAAFVGGLGASGVRWLLTWIGSGGAAADSDLVRLLAGSLGCPPPDGGDDTVGAVLRPVTVDPRDPDQLQDAVAVGMGEVLAVAFAGRGAPGRPALLSDWGAQILQREGTLQARSPQDCRADRRLVGLRPGPVPDPVATVLELLAREGQPGSAAAVLATPQAWHAVLARGWPPDQANTLARVVALAGEEQGPAGTGATMAGLTALGSGLADGVPDGWVVDRRTAAVIAPALGAAAGEHAPAVAAVLTLAANGGPLPASQDAALRGLGYLTVDPRAEGAIRDGLRGWAVGSPVTLGGTGEGQLGSAIAGLSGYVAVREYGQRLFHTLHGFEERGRALGAQADWALMIGAPIEIAQGPVAEVAKMVAPLVAAWLGIDGTWDDGPDRGLVFTPETAATLTAAELSPEQRAEAVVLAEQAQAGFVATAVQLGSPTPPVSPAAPGVSLLDFAPDVGTAKDAVDGMRRLLSTLPGIP